MSIKENKTILVTGATGLAGSGLINCLLQNNFTVFVISRVAQLMQHENLHWIKFDIITNEIESLLKTIPEINGVIHAAAHVKQSDKNEDIELFRRINIEFTDKLFRYFALRNIAIPIIYISSLGFLQRPLNTIIAEGDTVAPNTFYFLSKYWGELSLMEYSKASKYRPIILRISSPVSNNFNLMHNTVIKKWIESGKSGNPITIYGTGGRKQDFVSTFDIAEAAVLSLKNITVSGKFNIASGTSISLAELAGIIAGFFNVKIEYEEAQEDTREIWNISIKRAVEKFGYKPKYSSTDAINDLLRNTFENSNS